MLDIAHAIRHNAHVHNNFFMKKQLIYSATLAASAVLFTSCFDSEKPEENQQQQVQQPAKPEPPAQPTDEEISRMLLAQLPASEKTTAGALKLDPPQKNDDGSLSLNARLSMVVKENLYASEAAPAAFNKEREAVNDVANRAMKPESVYLLQIGAPTEMLTDADRAAKPLPQELQNLLNELKELADSSVYRKAFNAGDDVTVSAGFHATYQEGKGWVFDNIMLDNAALLALEDLTAESALPANAPNVLTPEFEEARKNQIREKIAAFKQQTEPYILSREETARATYTEYQAKAEEEARRAAEVAEAQATEKREWQEACVAHLVTGKAFAGEWTRGNDFGELTLQIEVAQKYDTSIQFFGTLYDTKLPEAFMQVEGRCNLDTAEQGARIDISIYEGQYDESKPTAEVFDANDGMVVLHLTKEGKLSGVMTCASWGEESEKAFKLNLSPLAEAPKKGRR